MSQNITIQKVLLQTYDLELVRVVGVRGDTIPFLRVRDTIIRIDHRLYETMSRNVEQREIHSCFYWESG